MEPFQRDFIAYAMECGVLRFGDFTLKSGRSSPYFFNAGLFNTGARLDRLGAFYASAILHFALEADVLFGPAYKGIPLVCATAMALSRPLRRDSPFAFNRKETKPHGEGGHLIGAPLRGSVLIIDDVITAGTSVKESVALIRAAGAAPAGVLIALDRQEKGTGEHSAMEEIQARYGLPVYSIINLRAILSYLEMTDRHAELDAVNAYQARFGAP